MTGPGEVGKRRVGKRRVIQVSLSRSPFETYLLVACVIAGIAGLVDPSRGSSAIRAVLPQWELYMWYAGITVGATAGLTGLFLHSMMSLYIERAGLLFLIGLCFVYSMSIILVGGVNLALAALTVVFFAVACIVRVHQITAEVRVVRKALDEH